jgi:hypothetical protein
MSTIEEVYEQYKHLDGCLSDPEWCTSGEGAAIYAIAGELWRAVKEARNKPRPPCEECIYQSELKKRDPELPSCFGTATPSDACFRLPLCKHRMKCKLARDTE